jgi:hypothetical protein
MNVGVFLHGTAIMHAAAAGVTRQQRVQQVRRRDPSVADFGSYIPTPGTAAKLAAWRRQGAVIAYLSSHRRAEDLRADDAVIRQAGFPAGSVHARGDGEDYGALAGRLGLDVLVEDDCESIGGIGQTCAAQLSPEARMRVRCVLVPEFGGLGDLPDDPQTLLVRDLPIC